MDLYGPLLAKALFPAFEAARGRPTMPLLRFLETSQRWSLERLRDLQVGMLRRLVRHAYQHTAYYRDVMDERGIRPEDITSVDDLAQFPLLDRDTVRATMNTRLAGAGPRVAIKKSTSGTTGEPVVVWYNRCDASARLRLGRSCDRQAHDALLGLAARGADVVQASQDRARSPRQARPLRRLHAARR
jgi:phenylacetate-CoA ligase